MANGRCRLHGGKTPKKLSPEEKAARYRENLAKWSRAGSKKQREIAQQRRQGKMEVQLALELIARAIKQRPKP